MNTRTLFFLVLAAPVVFLGCSSDSTSILTPTADVDRSETGKALAWDFASELIGTEGGSIMVDSVSLVVPAGALTTQTMITMTKNTDGSVELGPHGQTFAVPVQLTFVTAMAGGGVSYTVEWFNPTAESWQTITSSRTLMGQLAPLEHFSLYQLAIRGN